MCRGGTHTRNNIIIVCVPAKKNKICYYIVMKKKKENIRIYIIYIYILVYIIIVYVYVSRIELRDYFNRLSLTNDKHSNNRLSINNQLIE
jgi:hypothetical protein